VRRFGFHRVPKPDGAFIFISVLLCFTLSTNGFLTICFRHGVQNCLVFFCSPLSWRLTACHAGRRPL